MITCKFEDGHDVLLRHTTANALVIKENKILLTIRADFLNEGGKYCLPGGFLNRDETIEEGIKREVKEETGYETKNVKLFRINSNPNRRNEDRQNIDFLFLAEVGKQTSQPDHEVAKMEWIDLDNLPSEEKVAFDHFENIELYKKYQKEKFELPKIT